MAIIRSAYNKPNRKEPESSKMLTFHTLFNMEFSGSSAKEVVQALYEDSKKGMEELSFEDWWKYQQVSWQGKYALSIPPHDKPDACEKLLNILIKVGVLEEGKLPDKGSDKPSIEYD